jgi:peptidoglycan/LPS O-acetylase OafA/YrhL
MTHADAPVLPRSASSRHIPALDGVRGVAILMVMLFHTLELPRYPKLSAVIVLGQYGVDLFFVLSGYLISGILLRTKEQANYFSNFYARRALRIFPLYYLYLILYYVFVIKLRMVRFDAGRTADATAAMPWLWWYGTNLLILKRGNFIVSSLNHLWSLAVEEHFYLFWPLLVLLVNRKTLIRMCLIGLVGSVGLRFLLVREGVSGFVIDTFTACRLDGFFVGALLVCIEPSHWMPSIRRLAPYGMCAALVFVPLLRGTFANLIVNYSLLAIGFALLLVQATEDAGGWFVRIFDMRTLRLFGKYSYALYLFHYPIQIAFAREFPTAVMGDYLHSSLLAGIAHSFIVICLSLAVAYGSWHLYEKRFLTLKSRFSYSRVPASAEPALVGNNFGQDASPARIQHEPRSS